MGDHAVLAGVKHRVVLVEPAGDVVGRGDRRQRRQAQTGRAHHPDVGPADRQDRRRSVGRRRHRWAGRQLGRIRVAGQERRQMRARRHRSDAGTAAAVRDAERLVQVQVADVAAELSGSGQPDQRVEVGAVDVDLAAGVVHGRADLGDVLLVHAVRRRVGDHQRRQPVGVLADLGAQVVEVDVAVGPAGHHDHPHAGQRRRGGVGAVRAGRDQADVAFRLAAAGVVGVDRQQPGVLPLRSGVGLQRHRVVAGHLHQPGLQIGDQPPQALAVGRRRERVLAGELRPGDRLHLGRGVELHRARAERNHAAVQRKILVGQRAQVPHHRRLGAVLDERRVGQELRRARRDVGGCGLARTALRTRPAPRPHARRSSPRRRPPTRGRRRPATG